MAAPDDDDRTPRGRDRDGADRGRPKATNPDATELVETNEMAQTEESQTHGRPDRVAVVKSLSEPDAENENGFELYYDI